VSSLLAYDLATRTGWCYQDAEELTSGFFDLLDGGWAYRLDHFTKVVYDQLVAWRPDAVVVEQPQFMRSRDAARVCYSLYQIVQELCAAREIPCLDAYAATIKKWATGSGKAKKPAMVAALRRLDPTWRGKDHNEADARLIALYCRSEGMLVE
jgi:Holliday junction resolvasome RuvABC endonuclease subunit